jgi:hypothetical protein
MLPAEKAALASTGARKASFTSSRLMPACCSAATTK